VLSDPLGWRLLYRGPDHTHIEEAVVEYLKRIEEMGGAIKAVESGFIQKEIQDAAYEYHQDVDRQDAN
jgi:methylmalonyl-CoA mutase N-terminal domain/subunit